MDDPANAFSNAAYKRTDAAIAKGEADVKRRAEESAAWNSPENAANRRKQESEMFTGRVKPVDQLVRERGQTVKAEASMTTSRPAFSAAASGAGTSGVLRTSAKPAFSRARRF